MVSQKVIIQKSVRTPPETCRVVVQSRDPLQGAGYIYL